MSGVRTLALGVLVWLAAHPAVEAAALGVADANPGNLRGFLRWTILPYGNSGVAPAQPAAAPLSAPTPQPAGSTAMVGGGTAGLFTAVGSATVIANTTAAPAPAFAPPSAPPPPAASAPPAPPSPQVDARIDLGGGPFAQQSQLTGGNPQPWYLSPEATKVFGGVPNADQRAAFSNAVAQRVEQIYTNSGLPISLTTDPNVTAAHTLSVVAGTSYPGNPDAVGITDVGNNGFSFVDKFGYAQDWPTLAKAVGANVAHELMHAFGGEHHDTTGQYLDAAVTPWETMTADGVTFSAAAVQDLSTKDFQAVGLGVYDRDGQQIAPPVQPVPEPATVAVWTVLTGVAVAGRGYRARRRAA